MTIQDLILQKMESIEERLNNIETSLALGDASFKEIEKKQGEISESMCKAMKDYDALRIKMDRTMAVLTGVVITASFFGVPQRIIDLLKMR